MGSVLKIKRFCLLDGCKREGIIELEGLENTFCCEVA